MVIMRAFTFSFTFFLIAFLAHSPVFACLPGIPCIVSASGNDPAVDGDGPNAEGAPNAKKSDSDSCDADFMNQIYARAAMEAEREIIMAGVGVRKPDSVLELSCFDRTAYSTMKNSSQIFSKGGTSSTVDSTIKAFANHIMGSFSQKFLARQGNKDPDYEVGDHTNTAPCDMMNIVHQLAQCYDFDSTADKKVSYVGRDKLQFMTFETLALIDPRVFPTRLSCNRRGMIDNWNIALASNRNGAFAAIDRYPLPIDPDTPGPACREPISTGITITQRVTNRGGARRNQTRQVEERICIDPFCYFDKASTSCKMK